MGHAVLLTGPERRRRWSLEDRAQILAEAFAPGAVVSEVARRFEVSTCLLYRCGGKLWSSRPSPPLSKPSLLALPAVMRSKRPCSWTSRMA
ncbi:MULTISPECIES: transposase [unclassified Pararhizobium]|uniref:transposase n=1 Tax=unclassified Pararhizobium TaxID=2643050 RepID=UPI003F50D324